MDFGAGKTEGGDLKVDIGLINTLFVMQTVIGGRRRVFHTTPYLFGVTEDIAGDSKKTFKGSLSIF